jgi:protein SCO1/2
VGITLVRLSLVQVRQAVTGCGVLAAVAAVALTCAGCGSSSASTSAAAPTSQDAGTASSKLLGVPVHRRRAPAFTLRDQNGRPISLTRQRGSYVILAFLYTHCPDVCPVIATELNRALRELRSSRRAVTVLAVSVDPRGDTPAAVRNFVARHHLVTQFRYLTGSRRQLAHVWSAYNVAAYPQGATVVAHSATELLIDPRGFQRLAYPSDVTAREVVHDVRILERT